MPKLQQIVAVLQQASAPPPELALLEELLDAPDEAALNKMLEQHTEEITPELSSIIANILARSEEQAGNKPQGEDAQTIEKLRTSIQSCPQILDEEEHEIKNSPPNPNWRGVFIANSFHLLAWRIFQPDAMSANGNDIWMLRVDRGNPVTQPAQECIQSLV